MSRGTENVAAAVDDVGSDTRPSADMLVDWYERMWTIRQFEEHGLKLYEEGLVRGTLHTYTGMEGGAVGACAALEDGDLMCTYHRGHGHCLARGLDPLRMLAELAGREQGYCRGKGGTMHVASFEHGVLGADGVVGGLVPVAVGAAYALRLAGKGRVALAFFGEGALNQGVFFESLNLAKVFNTPTVFICENNEWSLNTQSRTVTAGDALSRAAACEIPATRVDATDIEAVYAAARWAVDRGRSGRGPSLIDLATYRWHTHSGFSSGDPREPAEVEERRKRDPIVRLAERLIERGLVTDESLRARRERISSELEQVAAHARLLPPPSRDSAFEDALVEVG